MTGSNKCLLDTSIIIQALKRDVSVGQTLDRLAQTFVPLTVVGELLYGAYKSTHLTKHLQQVEYFLVKCTILSPDRTTADLYGRTKADLAQRGRQIPENDIWIAALAIQYNLPLYERDKHFREVDGLQLFNPLSPV